MATPTLSRSALEQFIRCPRCFYLHRKRKVSPPATFPLTLAVATDALLKNEFDVVRATGGIHPLWKKHKLRVRAYAHPAIDRWRTNFTGQRVEHTTGFTISGAVDDVWEDLESGDLIIVDYKSTSKQGTPSIDTEFGTGYKRQMEIYQWLFRHAGFPVSPTGYFLYVNGQKDGGFYQSSLRGVMRFETTLIPYLGDDSWVDANIHAAVACLQSDAIQDGGADCDPCRYFGQRLAIEG